MRFFIRELKNRLEERFDGTISETTIVKNNDSALTGLVFKKDNSNIGVNFYVDGLYMDYKDGKIDMDEAVDIVLDTINNANPEQFESPENFDLNRIGELEYVRDRIIPFVLEKERNAEYLKDKPYSKTKTDLVIAYKVLVSEDDEEGMASVTIDNNLLGRLGITLTELKKIAFKNETKRFEFKTMFETFCEMMGEEMAKEMAMADGEDMNVGMDVLSNKTKHFGAVEMFNPVAIKEVKKKTGKDTFYILPSSIHEVLIITAPIESVQQLKNMVLEVNATEVAPKDRLSDSVYFYNGKSVEKVA